MQGGVHSESMFGRSGWRHDASGVSARHRALVPPGRNRSETQAAGPYRVKTDGQGGAPGIDVRQERLAS